LNFGLLLLLELSAQTGDLGIDSLTSGELGWYSCSSSVRRSSVSVSRACTQ
jgi:hypothetical protein